jgi:Exoribonuclease R
LIKFPRPHAGLGIPAYATVSSPLRRYTDLFNQGQVLSHLQSGVPLFSQDELSGMLPLIAARSDAASSVQNSAPVLEAGILQTAGGQTLV